MTPITSASSGSDQIPWIATLPVYFLDNKKKPDKYGGLFAVLCG